MIIEDTQTRTRKHQAVHRDKLNALIGLGAPDILIRQERMFSQMTITEYEQYQEEQANKHKEHCIEYAKYNKVQQSIVDQIYERESKLGYDTIACSSFVRFIALIDPLNFMSNDDFQYDLYETFLRHAHDIYWERHAVEYNKTVGE